ncbi:hypothetical protein D3869_26155 (plasmid) [Azospirillum brasilense]|uniref:Uncharacterized protein n=2 Tax=Azospirillum brasilense TaxID=192 RepID=A0A4D8R9P6_AZOBR|nr:hypothetical protein D3869_26155 [Azospirillum brasilense]
MDAVAAAATLALGLPVAPSSQRDTAQGWTAAAVHPLQPSQSDWLRMVRGSSFGIAATGERTAVETAAMGRLFVAGEGAPTLLGVPPGAVYEGERFPLPDDRLTAARRLLKQTLGIVGAAKDGQPIGSDAISRRLRGVRDILLPLIEAYAGPAEAGGTSLSTGPFMEERRQLRGLDQDMAAAQSWDAVEAIMAGLARIVDGLGDAALAAGGVHLSYDAEAACRLQLAIRFKVASDSPVPADRLADADRVLTRLLNGGYPQLAGWLCDRLRALARRVAESDPSGNSRLIVLEDGRAGPRGWAVRILVNPGLPAPAWFALFRRLHNLLVMALFSLKLELYGLLHRLAGAAPAGSPAADGADETATRGGGRRGMEYGRNGCAAVLVDVTIPRHGTLALQQQWRRFTGDVRLEDGLPRPGAAYRITSALRAVDSLCRSAPPPGNAAPALISRLHGLLTGQDQATADGVAAIRARIREGVVPLSLTAIDRLGDTAARRLLVVILEQFCQGYGLATDKALATAFDGWFAAAVPNYADLADLPVTVSAAIKAAKDKGAWSDETTATASAVGFGLWVSGAMESHLEKRASFLRDRFEESGSLLTCLTSLPSPEEARNAPDVQPVIQGPWAAALQLEQGLPRQGSGAAAAPVDIRLQDGASGRPPDELLTAAASRIADWLAAQRSGFALVRDGGRLAIVWHEEVDLGLLRYAPVAATLAVTGAAPGGTPPSLIRGLPVAALSDTIRSVRESLAQTDDGAVRSRLAATLNALTAISLRSGAPEGADPSVTALRQGRCRHLMLSSAEQAQGSAADYPRSYYPDDAVRIVLHDNPVDAAQRLGPSPTGAEERRTLDLLVVNQGSGGRNADGEPLLSPGTWTADALAASVVAPLMASGWTARTVVLDFPFSVQMLEVFAPLCAGEGRIVMTLGDSLEPIMDRGMWDTIRPALGQGDAEAVRDAIDRQVAAMTAAAVGRLHLDEILTASNAAIHEHLASHPDGRDAVSVLRCLKPIGDVLQDPDTPLDRIDAVLRALRGTPLPRSDFTAADQALLDDFPGSAKDVTADSLSRFQDRLRQRVETVLSDHRFRIGLDPAWLAGRPLYGSQPDCLWNLLSSRWSNILGLDPGLSQGMARFAVFDCGTGAIRLVGMAA